jgi:hypothetical protein
MTELPNPSPLVQMMLDSAADEIASGDLESALEYSMAVIAVEPTPQAYITFIKAALLVISRTSPNSTAKRLLARVENNDTIALKLNKALFEKAFSTDHRRILFSMARASGKPELSKYLLSQEVIRCTSVVLNNVERLAADAAMNLIDTINNLYSEWSEVLYFATAALITIVIFVGLGGTIFAVLLGIGALAKTSYPLCAGAFFDAADEFFRYLRTDEAHILIALIAVTRSIAKTFARQNVRESVELPITILAVLLIMLVTQIATPGRIHHVRDRFDGCLYQATLGEIKLARSR